MAGGGEQFTAARRSIEEDRDTLQLALEQLPSIPIQDGGTALHQSYSITSQCRCENGVSCRLCHSRRFQGVPMKISTALSGFDITTSTEQNTFQNQPVTVDPVACQAAWPAPLPEALASTQKDVQHREPSSKTVEDLDTARYEPYLKGAIDEDAFGCGLEDIPWPSRLVQVEFKYGWSVGTALHDSGTCKPCCFITSQPGCLNGVECDFCHMRHKRSDRPRPGKQKRERFKKCQTRVYDEAETKSLMCHNGSAGRNRQLFY